MPKSTQCTVEVVRSANQRQVSEGLREVAMLLSGLAEA
jgi:hypothetical protein